MRERERERESERERARAFRVVKFQCGHQNFEVTWGWVLLVYAAFR